MEGVISFKREGKRVVFGNARGNGERWMIEARGKVMENEGERERKKKRREILNVEVKGQRDKGASKNKMRFGKRKNQEKC